MKQEKVILSFVAILIGLIVTGAAFFLFQNSKKITTINDTISKKISPTPQPQSSFFLILNEPKDESVTNKKSITVSGKTKNTATIVVITSADQQVLKPSLQGDFSTTIQIGEGLNYIRVHAINSNGENQIVERVVGFTTEDF